MTTTFRADDGVEIAYHLWGEPTGRPVVLHHGFIAGAVLNWEAPGIVDALVAAGRRVVGIDARGHGASAKPHDPALYGEPRMARDLLALIDVLGADEVDLVGYSMGAIVSVIAGADPRVRRLVIGGVGAGVLELGGIDTRVIDPEALLAALRTDDPTTITDPQAAAFRGFADLVGADRAALAAHAASLHRSPIDLAAVKAPALVLAGDADDLAQRPEVLAAALPDARAEVFPGDHLGVLRDPGFRSALVGFVQSP